MYLDYRLERQNRIDFVGLFFVVTHISLFSITIFMPCIGVPLNLDPFYHVFELILPSPYDRSITVILTVPLIRLFLALVCVFEFARFFTIFLFVCISMALTLVTCLRQLVKQSAMSECKTLKLYTQLRVVLKIGDYVIRYVLLFFLTGSQFYITTLWWLVLKCWHLLPGVLTMLAFQAVVGSTFAVVILLPRQIEVCTSSKNLVARKIAQNHTFCKDSRNRYLYLRWKSEYMLPVRFGGQFTLSRDTPMGYLNVLVTNLTNAALLIEP